MERNAVDKLPIVNEEMHKTDTVIKVGDSRPGWAKSLKELIAMLYSGQIPKFDVSEVRPAGARLTLCLICYTLLNIGASSVYKCFDQLTWWP